MSDFKLILCDFSEGLCKEWETAFKEFPEVEVRYGIFEHIDFDCINSPANSFGLMDGGIDEAISMYFGQEMNDRVHQMIISNYGGEQPVGTSEIVVGTSTEDLAKGKKLQYVSHTPTMIIPELISGKDNVYMAMKAMLLAVQRHNKNPSVINNSIPPIKTLVCSGLGTGAGRVSHREAAINMAKAYESFKRPLTRLDWTMARIRYKHIKGV